MVLCSLLTLSLAKCRVRLGLQLLAKIANFNGGLYYSSGLIEIKPFFIAFTTASVRALASNLLKIEET